MPKNEPTPEYSKQLAFIESCNDKSALQLIRKNAQKLDVKTVDDAAFNKLIRLVPGEIEGSLEHDFWTTINAFELNLKEERGKTTLLSRTRQKVGRVGVAQTLRDWALKPGPTDGFKMLLEREMAELTGEAIVLRHQNRFTADTIAAAQKRLTDAGVDVASLPRKL